MSHYQIIFTVYIVFDALVGTAAGRDFIHRLIKWRTGK